jgi:hypothetical protein
MRSLEVHYFETERDLSLALTSDLILAEQLAATDCTECGSKLCYSDTTCEFSPFVLVVDENDQDWVVCQLCAGPIISYVNTFFPPVVRSRFATLDDHIDDDEEFFL